MRKAKQKPKQKTQAEELRDYFGQFNPRTDDLYISEVINCEDVPEAIRGPFAAALLNFVEYLALLVEGREEILRNMKSRGKPLTDQLAIALAQRDRKTGKPGFQHLRERRAATGN
jgi:hypothetical protein